MQRCWNEYTTDGPGHAVASTGPATDGTHSWLTAMAHDGVINYVGLAQARPNYSENFLLCHEDCVYNRQAISMIVLKYHEYCVIMAEMVF